MATAAGLFLALCWPAALGAIVVFILVVVFFRFVSLGSIAAAAAMPLLIYLLWAPHQGLHLAPPASVTIGAFAAAMLVIYKHDGNIQRLVEGARAALFIQQGIERRDRRVSRIAILGAGSWGTALAIVLSRGARPHEIWLWSRDANHAQSISRSKENRKYLPQVPVPAAIRLTHSMVEAMRGASIVIGAMPSAHARKVYSAAADAIGADAIVVSATKGWSRDRTRA